jgi:hypothetical protein
MHRFVWDMHWQPMPGALQFLDANQAVKHDTPVMASSPWVMPGTYTVKLTVGGKTYSQPLVVKMDPRVKTSAADLQQQFDKSMQAYEEAMAASQALGQVRDLEKQVAARKSSDKLAAYEKQLETLSGPKATSPFAFFFHRGPPNLGSVGGDLQMLMLRMQGADEAPTAADLAALDKTSAELKSLMDRWNTLKGQPLAALNRTLQKNGQPPLTVARAVAPFNWNAGWITTNRDQEEQ